MKRERREFRAGMSADWGGRLGSLYFLDEFGSHLGLTRLYGRAQPGRRVVEATPGYSGPHFTTVAALGLTGVCAPLVFEGAMNGLIFATYVQTQLGPCLQPGDILVVDNLAAHRNAQARAELEARGVQLVYLPPYSPDFNPIELCWSKVKQALRAAKARTFEALVDALAVALRAVAPPQICAWFSHCGYQSA